MILYGTWRLNRARGLTTMITMITIIPNRTQPLIKRDHPPVRLHLAATKPANSHVFATHASAERHIGHSRREDAAQVHFQPIDRHSLRFVDAHPPRLLYIPSFRLPVAAGAGDDSQSPLRHSPLRTPLAHTRGIYLYPHISIAPPAAPLLPQTGGTTSPRRENRSPGRAPRPGSSTTSPARHASVAAARARCSSEIAAELLQATLRRIVNANLPESSALKVTGGEGSEASRDSLNESTFRLNANSLRERFCKETLCALHWERIVVGFQRREPLREVVRPQTGDQLARGARQRSLRSQPLSSLTNRTSCNSRCNETSFWRNTRLRTIAFLETTHCEPTSTTLRHQRASKQYFTPSSSKPTGGSWKKSPAGHDRTSTPPHKTTWIPPNGWSLLRRTRATYSRVSKSAPSSIEISSMTSTSHVCQRSTAASF